MENIYIDGVVNFDNVLPERVYHNKAGIGGQSGSSAYHLYIGLGNASCQLSAIVSHKLGSSTGYTLISPLKYQMIQNVMLNSIPLTGLPDLAPSAVTVMSDSVIAGNQINSMQYKIMNYSSSAWSGSVIVRVYLSNNDDISTYDTLIQTRQFIGTIDAKQYVLINASSPLPQIPDNISGDLWLGIVLDIIDEDIENNNTDEWNAAHLIISNSTNINEILSNDIAPKFHLSRNYPNPFNPSTTIQFDIPKQAKVTLKIIDMMGREVATLVDEKLPPGAHKITFDTGTLPSGVYFYRLQADEFSATKKLMLLK